MPLTGDAAKEAVSGLKQSPVLLAVVCLNVIAIVGGGWFLKGISANNHAILQAIIERCMDGQVNGQK